MRETLRTTFQRVFKLENRRAAVRPGRLESLPFRSQVLGASRDLTVYLPPGYDENIEKRYPVLYMHDGQNLFDPRRAFIPGQHWRLSEAADQAIAERHAAPMIIVGIDNGGAARIDEYTHVRDEQLQSGGRAPEHGRMLIEEIKPLVDVRYRAIPEAAAIGGSSLGGLVSLFLALRNPTVFTGAAVMSPSVWWAGRSILDEIDRYEARERCRIWLDVGGREGEQTLADARELRDRLAARGWTDETLRYQEDRRGDHSERAWARRAQPMLEFLFPLS